MNVFVVVFNYLALSHEELYGFFGWLIQRLCIVFSTFFIFFHCEYFTKSLISAVMLVFCNLLDIRQKLKVHKTFRRRLRHLLDILGTLNLHLMSRGRYQTFCKKHESYMKCFAETFEVLVMINYIILRKIHSFIGFSMPTILACHFDLVQKIH